MADYPASKEEVPPATLAEPLEDVRHGVKLTDPYRWLEDERAPRVQAWMKSQDAYARERLAKLAGRDALLRRYTELYYLESVSVPVKRGGRTFYSRTHKDKEKAVVYWRDGERGHQRVLLDPNAWSEDGTVSLGVWVPSWDGKKVVFGKRPNAADESTLHVMDVESGRWSEIDVIPGGKYARPSWTADSRAFYYEWLPTDPAIAVSERPGFTEIRLHRLGADPGKDSLVHPRTGNPSTFLSQGLSRDGKYLFVSVDRGWNENDLFFRRTGKDKAFRRLVEGRDAKYEVAAWRDQLYVMTDEGAPNKRILKAHGLRPERKTWKEIVPEDPKAAMESFALVGGHLAVSYLRDASSELRLFTLEGKPVRTVALPSLGTASNLAGLEDDDEAYFAFSSFTLPREVYRTSVKTGKADRWAKVEVPIDPSPYLVEQVFYPSKDGTRISMFIVRRKDLAKDGENPTLLYGYGGFDVSLTPSFNSFIYPWLEAGGVYAVPNLRGGGEYGKAWHDAGKLHLKQNVFDDFLSAADYLIRERYTRPGKLAIRGASNGGLLVGAAMTQRAELFGAVVCAVPLLDMVRYHLFGSGKTWIPEYGDPEKQEDFKVLHAYSPYHRVQKGIRYPPLLMMSADHDDRVDPMHARKFVAAVQTLGSGRAPTWLRIEMNAGHGGADQVRRSIESSADQIAFLLRALSVSPGGTGASARVRSTQGPARRAGARRRESQSEERGPIGAVL
ncbi:MAG: S9 family peptidase [Myxococcales bacterium]|nr:S9 family peptidase [Myxococcales bacterium]